MYFCAQMHLLISPGVHASPQPRTEITGMWVSDIRSQVLVPGQKAMRPSSHPWHTHFQLLPTDSRCVSASLLAATCHHSIGSRHSQPKCSKPSKQLQAHSWDTRTTTAAAERTLGTQSQGTHIHHGWTLRAVCKWDTATTQNSLGNLWHRDVQQTQS